MRINSLYKAIASYLIVICIVVYSNNALISASDIKNHWARTYIQKLIDKNIIKGTPDGLFNPDSSISVAEFVTMVVRINNTDVPNARHSEHWAVPFFQSAINDGLVKPGEFMGLNNLITRGEMARIVARSAKLPRIYNQSTIVNSLYDFPEIKDELKEYIAQVFTYKIINGYPDGKFKCDRYATRAEASVMIVRMMEIKN